MDDAPRDYLLYDGACPACSAYVGMSKLRERWPGLQMLNARDAPDLVASLRARGYEINEGFVLCLGGKIHFGAEATRAIADGGGGQAAQGSLMLKFIGSAPWSRRLYPWLNRGRQALLWLLGRGLIK